VTSGPLRLSEILLLSYYERRVLVPGLTFSVFVLQVEDVQAAEWMESMRHSALREDVTLLEGADDLVAERSRFPTYFQGGSGTGGGAVGQYASAVPDLLLRDDSLVILDRLREVTQTALQLEVSSLLLLICCAFSCVCQCTLLR
jgi:hypothetical protein